MTAIPTSDLTSPAGALAEIAWGAALLVAPYLRAVARSRPDVSLKADIHDPVTVHDRRTEGAIRKFLAELVPGSRVLGEEMGAGQDLEQIDAAICELGDLPVATAVRVDPRAASTAGALSGRVRWIVDPIDGTANFAAGLTYFGTSIGVELDGEIVAGVVSIPFNHELFVADDVSAWHVDESTGERTALRSSGPSQESEALLATYYPNAHNLNEDLTAAAARERDLLNAYGTVRRPGAGAVDLAMVAAGWIGASMGVSFKPWDVAAGIHLVKMAGGKVLNLPMGTGEPDGLRPGVVSSVGTLDAVTARRVLGELDTLSALP